MTSPPAESGSSESPMAEPGHPLETTIPTAAIQRQIVAHEATIEGAPAYNLLAGAALEGPINVERLAAAFSGLVAGHPALRACMVPTADGLAQSIAPPDEFAGGITVAGAGPGEAVERAREFARQPIDVFSRPTLRLGVFEEPPAQARSQASVLALVAHHAFTDGQSLTTLCAELGARYADPEATREGVLPGVDEWGSQVDEYCHEIAAADLAAGGAGVTGSGLPLFRSGLGGIVIELLGERRSAMLRECARAAKVTPFTVGLTAFALALRACFGFQRLELSVPVTTRASRRAFDLVGPLMRMVRVQIEPTAPTVGDLLRETQQAVFGAASPVGGSVEANAEAWSLEYGLAFAADVEPAQYLALPGVEVEPLVLHPGTAVFGLTATLETIRGNELRLRIEAAAEVMGYAESHRLLGDVIAAIDDLAGASLDRKVGT
jgi:hypothetical protein